MQCPFCESSLINRDYAPPRSYALILLGLALIFVEKFVRADFFRWSEADLQKLYFVGAVVFVFGLFDLFRHGNRFCASCGFRFRQTASRKTGEPVMVCALNEKRTVGEKATGSRKINPHTKIEPILKCLRLKNEKMRAEAVETLSLLTGQDFGLDADAWDKWWEENREEYKAGLAKKK
jgi:hypothetical protein